MNNHKEIKNTLRMRMLPMFFLYSLITLFSTFATLANLAYATTNFMPGLIPLEFGQRPATDLIYNGKLLSPDDAYKMVMESNGKFDLSKLNPDDTSELWNNKKIPAPLSANENKIDVAKDEMLNYLSQVPSRQGNFRFTIEKVSRDGSKRSYTIMLNKNIHNVLLKKSLLEKIGYNVPPIKYLPKIKIKFLSYMEKELFFDNMAKETFGDPGRWVVKYKDHLRAKKNPDDIVATGNGSGTGNGTATGSTFSDKSDEVSSSDEDDDDSEDDEGDPDDERDPTKDGPLASSDEVELQDVVIMEDQDHLYNLGLGYIPSSVIQGRRILNSLIIPFALVEVPESVNLFNWYAGRIVNDQVQLTYDTAEEFTTSFEDAQWMARRILSLYRKDFVDIVKSAHFPEAVGLLVVEKLISRRNQMVSLFKLEKEFNILEVDTEISSGDYLEDGKLLKEKWEGYASRFSFGDPESPLSRSEIFAFIKSKAMSTVINTAVGVANKYLTSEAFLGSALKKRQEELFFKQLGEFLRTGKVVPVPLGVWAFPIFGAKLIAARNVIAGNYLGTDNVVQLADAIGFNVEAGVFLNVEGINAGVPLSVTSKIKGSYTRTYTHLRPIKSFKASLKYPFKNLLVPLLLKQLGHFFDDILYGEGELEGLKPEEKQKQIEKIMREFKDELSVGESLLITDSVGAGLNLGVGVAAYQVLKAQAEFGASQAIISRLHIHRKDENTIQIYRDLGNVTSLIMSLNFKAAIPVLNVSAKFSAGSARIKFYSLNINENEKENPDFLKNLQALKAVLLNNSLERAAAIRKPYYVKHTFLEAQFKAGIFFFQLAGLASQTEIEITHPKGAVRRFFRTVGANRRGLNFEQYTVELVNNILSDYAEFDINLNMATSANPGDTLGGKSFSQVVSFEGEIIDKYGFNSAEDVVTPFARLSKNWKGWSISRWYAEKIIEGLNNVFDTEFYPDNVLNQTKKIFLYNIGVDIYVYEKAIESMVSFDRSEIAYIFKNNRQKPGYLSRKWTFEIALSKYRKAYNKGHYRDVCTHLRTMLGVAFNSLTLDGLTELFGGKKNFLVVSRFDGFREGDEDGDKPIFSSTVGQVAGKDMSGPLMKMMEKTGMTQSEFFAYWLLDRLN
ncbi:MAG: hypothetical protein HQK49_11970 [Oligoflexia bacterium]|nr:hypothetical protein [Oligoflexia bacterium]